MARNQALATLLLPALNAAMAEREINSPTRMAAFLAQIAHESGEFRFMSEEWGPTAVQKRYDPPFKLSKVLGNDKPGDGFKYRGAGPLQLTGKDNFRTYGKALGLDLVNKPDLARDPKVGLRIAALFWERKGLNTLADSGDFTGITHRINGGENGLEQREAYWKVAKKALGVL